MTESSQKNEKFPAGSALGTTVAGISDFFFQPQLQEHENEFLSEMAYHNFVRIRILVFSVLIIFISLLVWDARLFLDGKWDESVGNRITALFHAILVAFLCGVIAVTWKRKPDTSAGVTVFHKAVTGISIPFVMACLTMISIGDVLANGSTVAYLGTVFAYAAIFLLTHRCCILLFGINMALMMTMLIMVRGHTGQSIDVQLINVSAFTVVAFILSRIIYLYGRKDFFNRLLIKKQSNEISRKNEEKEVLIRDLRSALDEVKTLTGFLPICASCKKIRDDKGYWSQIESYISRHSGATFSHSICPDCAQKLYPYIVK